MKHYVALVIWYDGLVETIDLTAYSQSEATRLGWALYKDSIYQSQIKKVTVVAK
jgi:hypothetical protein